MSTQQLTTTDSVLQKNIRLLTAVTEGFADNVQVQFWNGATWSSRSDRAARFCLVLKHEGALRQMLWPFRAVAFGEAYIFDDFDIEGDMFGLVAWIRHLLGLEKSRSWREKIRLLAMLLALPRTALERDESCVGKPRRRRQSIDRDRDGICFHYDRPAEFYRLFLGPTMQYTCSYFTHPDEDIDVSQQRKMEYICRKLRLQPGDKFLDVGCGWGGLLIYAAKHHGVQGVGLTLAGKQMEWAVHAIRSAGLENQIRIECGDYRQMPFVECFDKVSSIGMTEEVGRSNLPRYFSMIWQALKPGGAYLHHSITLRPGIPYPRWTAFARKYVFPNGQLHSLNEALDRACSVGFELRDVENLREHYSLTLKNWVRRLERHHDEAVDLTDEINYRIFRLYMAGATLGFDSGVYNLYQSLLVKPEKGEAKLPLTRASWYA